MAPAFSRSVYQRLARLRLRVGEDDARVAVGDGVEVVAPDDVGAEQQRAVGVEEAGGRRGHDPLTVAVDDRAAAHRRGS